uniref:Protein kinase domain-containing protein n=1 Tax=Chromera velia CCMP2878 TaxID=1169474 RepID=A0A0G4FNP5_9ALVE|eukprot:Cvel_3518.t1-p1 / transcript=Cvel_3518.t1 / gene=Cvel_3518 / organism=Chromera_velia_CCMP2878 / gene_product=Calcium-dependent protein kinase 2, putative / transcript_product=Calcium-dependent protein kinase 2, putative / location=Cvel_scaffold143:4205-17047(-) / protein_length=3598 / sequence_SO=supercontig / SO=protein_coding / is_pseudo=false
MIQSRQEDDESFGVLKRGPTTDLGMNNGLLKPNNSHQEAIFSTPTARIQTPPGNRFCPSTRCAGSSEEASRTGDDRYLIAVTWGRMIGASEGQGRGVGQRERRVFDDLYCGLLFLEGVRSPLVCPLDLYPTFSLSLASSCWALRRHKETPDRVRSKLQGGPFQSVEIERDAAPPPPSATEREGNVQDKGGTAVDGICKQQQKREKEGSAISPLLLSTASPCTRRATLCMPMEEEGTIRRKRQGKQEKSLGLILCKLLLRFLNSGRAAVDDPEAPDRTLHPSSLRPLDDRGAESDEKKGRQRGTKTDERDGKETHYLSEGVGRKEGRVAVVFADPSPCSASAACSHCWRERKEKESMFPSTAFRPVSREIAVLLSNCFGYLDRSSALVGFLAHAPRVKINGNAPSWLRMDPNQGRGENLYHTDLEKSHNQQQQPPAPATRLCVTAPGGGFVGLPNRVFETPPHGLSSSNPATEMHAKVDCENHHCHSTTSPPSSSDPPASVTCLKSRALLLAGNILCSFCSDLSTSWSNSSQPFAPSVSPTAATGAPSVPFQVTEGPWSRPCFSVGFTDLLSIEDGDEDELYELRGARSSRFSSGPCGSTSSSTSSSRSSGRPSVNAMPGGRVGEVGKQSCGKVGSEFWPCRKLSTTTATTADSSSFVREGGGEKERERMMECSVGACAAPAPAFVSLGGGGETVPLPRKLSCASSSAASRLNSGGGQQTNCQGPLLRRGSTSRSNFTEALPFALPGSALSGSEGRIEEMMEEEELSGEQREGETGTGTRNPVEPLPPALCQVGKSIEREICQQEEQQQETPLYEIAGMGVFEENEHEKEEEELWNKTIDDPSGRGRKSVGKGEKEKEVFPAAAPPENPFESSSSALEAAGSSLAASAASSSALPPPNQVEAPAEIPKRVGGKGRRPRPPPLVGNRVTALKQQQQQQYGAGGEGGSGPPWGLGPVDTGCLGSDHQLCGAGGRRDGAGQEEEQSCKRGAGSLNERRMEERAQEREKEREVEIRENRGDNQGRGDACVMAGREQEGRIPGHDQENSLQMSAPLPPPPAVSPSLSSLTAKTTRPLPRLPSACLLDRANSVSSTPTDGGENGGLIASLALSDTSLADWPLELSLSHRAQTTCPYSHLMTDAASSSGLVSRSLIIRDPRHVKLPPSLRISSVSPVAQSREPVHTFAATPADGLSRRRLIGSLSVDTKGRGGPLPGKHLGGGCMTFPAAFTRGEDHSLFLPLPLKTGGCGGTEDGESQLAVPTRGLSVLDNCNNMQRHPHSLANRFTILEKMGEGCSAVVRRVLCRATGSLYALKTVTALDEEMLDTTLAEFEIMRELDHPNIVKVCEFLDLSKVTGDVHILMELVEGPSLENAVSQCGGTTTTILSHGDQPGTKTVRRMTEGEARRLFRQLMDVLVYLRQQNITHRDVSLSNVLLSSRDPKTAELKLIDFNIAKRGETDGLMTPAGNPRFIAPEVTAGDYGAEVDVWSAGVCLHYMLTGFLPFDAPTKESLVRAIKEKPLSFSPKDDLIWDRVSPEAIDICRWCLWRNAGRRATPMEALRHPWTQGISVPPLVRDAMTARAVAGHVPDLRLYRRLLFHRETERGGVGGRSRGKLRTEPGGGVGGLPTVSSSPLVQGLLHGALEGADESTPLACGFALDASPSLSGRDRGSLGVEEPTTQQQSGRSMHHHHHHHTYPGRLAVEDGSLLLLEGGGKVDGGPSVGRMEMGGWAVSIESPFSSIAPSPKLRAEGGLLDPLQKDQSVPMGGTLGFFLDGDDEMEGDREGAEFGLQVTQSLGDLPSSSSSISLPRKDSSPSVRLRRFLVSNEETEKSGEECTGAPERREGPQEDGGPPAEWSRKGNTFRRERSASESAAALVSADALGGETSPRIRLPVRGDPSLSSLSSLPHPQNAASSPPVEEGRTPSSRTLILLNRLHGVGDLSSSSSAKPSNVAPPNARGKGEGGENRPPRFGRSEADAEAFARLRPLFHRPPVAAAVGEGGRQRSSTVPESLLTLCASHALHYDDPTRSGLVSPHLKSVPCLSRLSPRLRARKINRGGKRLLVPPSLLAPHERRSESGQCEEDEQEGRRGDCHEEKVDEEREDEEEVQEASPQLTEFEVGEEFLQAQIPPLPAGTSCPPQTSVEKESRSRADGLSLNTLPVRESKPRHFQANKEEQRKTKIQWRTGFFSTDSRTLAVAAVSLLWLAWRRRKMSKMGKGVVLSWDGGATAEPEGIVLVSETGLEEGLSSSFSSTGGGYSRTCASPSSAGDSSVGGIAAGLRGGDIGSSSPSLSLRMRGGGQKRLTAPGFGCLPALAEVDEETENGSSTEKGEEATRRDRSVTTDSSSSSSSSGTKSRKPVHDVSLPSMSHSSNSSSSAAPSSGILPQPPTLVRGSSESSHSQEERRSSAGTQGGGTGGEREGRSRERAPRPRKGDEGDGEGDRDAESEESRKGVRTSAEDADSVGGGASSSSKGGDADPSPLPSSSDSGSAREGGAEGGMPLDPMHIRATPLKSPNPGVVHSPCRNEEAKDGGEGKRTARAPRERLSCFPPRQSSLADDPPQRSKTFSSAELPLFRSVSKGKEQTFPPHLPGIVLNFPPNDQTPPSGADRRFSFPFGSSKGGITPEKMLLGTESPSELNSSSSPSHSVRLTRKLLQRVGVGTSRQSSAAREEGEGSSSGNASKEKDGGGDLLWLPSSKPLLRSPGAVSNSFFSPSPSAQSQKLSPFLAPIISTEPSASSVAPSAAADPSAPIEQNLKKTTSSGSPATIHSSDDGGGAVKKAKKKKEKKGKESEPAHKEREKEKGNQKKAHEASSHIVIPPSPPPPPPLPCASPSAPAPLFNSITKEDKENTGEKGNDTPPRACASSCQEEKITPSPSPSTPSNKPLWRPAVLIDKFLCHQPKCTTTESQKKQEEQKEDSAPHAGQPSPKEKEETGDRQCTEKACVGPSGSLKVSEQDDEEEEPLPVAAIFRLVSLSPKMKEEESKEAGGNRGPSGGGMRFFYELAVEMPQTCSAWADEDLFTSREGAERESRTGRGMQQRTPCRSLRGLRKESSELAGRGGADGSDYFHLTAVSPTPYGDGETDMGGGCERSSSSSSLRRLVKLKGMFVSVSLESENFLDFPAQAQMGDSLFETLNSLPLGAEVFFRGPLGVPLPHFDFASSSAFLSSSTPCTPPHPLPQGSACESSVGGNSLSPPEISRNRDQESEEDTTAQGVVQNPRASLPSVPPKTNSFGGRIVVLCSADGRNSSGLLVAVHLVHSFCTSLERELEEDKKGKGGLKETQKQGEWGEGKGEEGETEDGQRKKSMYPKLTVIASSVGPWDFPFRAEIERAAAAFPDRLQCIFCLTDEAPLGWALRDQIPSASEIVSILGFPLPLPLPLSTAPSSLHLAHTEGEKEKSPSVPAACACTVSEGVPDAPVRRGEDSTERAESSKVLQSKEEERGSVKATAAADFVSAHPPPAVNFVVAGPFRFRSSMGLLIAEILRLSQRRSAPINTNRDAGEPPGSPLRGKPSSLSDRCGEREGGASHGQGSSSQIASSPTSVRQTAQSETVVIRSRPSSPSPSGSGVEGERESGGCTSPVSLCPLRLPPSRIIEVVVPGENLIEE